MDQKPSIGRIVHSVSYGTPGGEYTATCRAAVVTAVNEDGTVSLCVLNPGGLFFNHNVPYEEWDSNTALEGAKPKGGTWHWPERV